MARHQRDHQGDCCLDMFSCPLMLLNITVHNGWSRQITNYNNWGRPGYSWPLLSDGLLHSHHLFWPQVSVHSRVLCDFSEELLHRACWCLCLLKTSHLVDYTIMWYHTQNITVKISLRDLVMKYILIFSVNWKFFIWFDNLVKLHSKLMEEYNIMILCCCCMMKYFLELKGHH